MRKTFIFSIAILLLSALGSFGQDLTTASDFFDKVSAEYAKIEDYQAHIVIQQNDTVMSGVIYHKRPNLVLVQFDDPKDQVLAVDGEKLTIYIPYLNVAMEQVLNKRDIPSVGLGTTAQGLEMMKSRYSIAYLDSQDPVPLDADNPELVRKLKLEWRSIDEGFRQLTVSIGADLFIRRFEGVTAGFEELQIDFTNIFINQNIPDGKFRYDSPPSANKISNWIFPPEE